MQKFIAIPMPRYNDLLDYEKQYKSSLGTVKEASDALVKNQETQEFVQRKQEYKEKQEDIPKTLDKEIPMEAKTILPPSSLIKRKRPIKPKNNKPFKITKKCLSKFMTGIFHLFFNDYKVRFTSTSS
jgi:hypothetical protein